MSLTLLTCVYLSQYYLTCGSDIMTQQELRDVTPIAAKYMRGATSVEVGTMLSVYSIDGQLRYVISKPAVPKLTQQDDLSLPKLTPLDLPEIVMGTPQVVRYTKDGF